MHLKWYVRWLLSNKIIETGAMGTVFPSGASEFKHRFEWGSCYFLFSFMCMFCRSLFVRLYFGHCVCLSSTYWFWLPTCYLQTYLITYLITWNGTLYVLQLIYGFKLPLLYFQTVLIYIVASSVNSSIYADFNYCSRFYWKRGRRGRDRMVVGFIMW